MNKNLYNKTNRILILQNELEELVAIEGMKNETFGFIEENIKSKLNYKKEIKKLEKEIEKLSNYKYKKKYKSNTKKHCKNNYYKRKLLKKYKPISYYNSRIIIRISYNNKEYFSKIYSKKNSKFKKNQQVKKIRKISKQITDINKLIIDDILI